MTTTKKTPAYVILAKRFKAFDKEMRDIWESHCLVKSYTKDIERLLRAGAVKPLSLRSLFVSEHDSDKSLSFNNTLGALSHLSGKANGRRTLVLAVATTETFLCELATIVYREYPAKLQGPSEDEQRERRDKLVALIVSSKTREEILEKMIEEKVRSIFYGNPSDFFLKDKAKIEFGDYYSKRFPSAIKAFGEVSARRNVIVHNGGRVDRKYLREVPGTSFVLDQIVPLDDVYLRATCQLLCGLAASATTLAMVTLKGTQNSLVRRRTALLEQSYK